MPPPLLLACLALLLAPSSADPNLPPLRASFLPPSALLLYGALPSPPSARTLTLRLAGAGGGAGAEVRKKRVETCFHILSLCSLALNPLSILRSPSPPGRPRTL